VLEQLSPQLLDSPASLNSHTVLSPMLCVTLNFFTAAALPFSAVYLPILAQSSGVNDFVYFRFVPALGLRSSSRPNAAVTAWFTSLRMFGGSWVWLDVGRLDFCLK